jgi:hypothetical protein
VRVQTAASGGEIVTDPAGPRSDGDVISTLNWSHGLKVDHATAFDESKMFDLVQLAKSTPEWQRIPFVAARVRPHILRSQTALRDAAFTCGALGAEAFLDIADYRVDPERQMREAIERLLDKSSRRD